MTVNEFITYLIAIDIMATLSGVAALFFYAGYRCGKGKKK